MALGIPAIALASDTESFLDDYDVYYETPEETTLDTEYLSADAWCLKSNLLYDAIGLPGIGVEMLVNHVSVGINFHYGWWRNKSAHHEFKGFVTELYGRYWFDEYKSMKGHHIGIYGDIFSYDYEHNGIGRLCGKPGDDLWETSYWATGFEYGYCWKITDKISLDFSIGVGYTTGICHKYKDMDNHNVWLSTYRRHYFGPTKAELSFVWMFDQKNGNKKGGNK